MKHQALVLAALACVAARGETFSGLLVDAGCPDRSARNLARTVRRDFPRAPGGKAPDRSPTREAVRSRAIEHQTADALARMSDRSCGVTAGTRSFALLTGRLRLLVLDPGGVTRAAVALGSSEAGRRMLDGSGPPVKPRVEIEGTVHGEVLEVRSLALAPIL